MRFNRHLKEDVRIPPDKLIDVLESKCMPYLKDVRKSIDKLNHFLFRGMKGASKNYFLKDVRQDRKPLDSPEAWHNDLGAGLKRKFGVDGRKQGLFCEMLPMSQYGTPYIVFPVGKYFCIWSDTIEDAAEWEPDAIYDYGGEGMQKAVDFHVDKLMKTYHKGDVNDAIKGVDYNSKGPRTEITVITKQYYAVSLDYQAYIEKWIKDEI